MAGSAEPPLPGVGGVGMMTGRDAALLGPDRRRHRPDRRDRQAVRPRAGAHSRGRPCARDGAAPVRPAAHCGWRRPSTARATSSIARRSTSWSPTPTSSCTSRSSSSRRPAQLRRQHRGIAQRVRGDGGARRAAARLHVVGRRLRLPRRTRACSPRTRRRAAPNVMRTPARRPRSSESCTSRSPGRPPTPTSSGPCIVAGPDAPALLDQLPTCASSIGCRPRCGRWEGARRQAGAARPRRPVPARAPRRRRRGAGRRRAGRGASRASTTSPGPARSARPTWPRSSAGTRSGSQTGRST